MNPLKIYNFLSLDFLDIFIVNQHDVKSDLDQLTACILKSEKFLAVSLLIFAFLIPEKLIYF